MAKTMTLNICHLYPDLMDTYGDKGNIITITRRCQWRGIKTALSQISVGNKLNPNQFDIYFFGGGQDKQQSIVGQDLQTKAKSLKSDIENGSVLLSICGGYQLLQNYFKTKEGEVIKGIGLFDAYTQGSDDRMIQNLLINLNPDLASQISKVYPTTNLGPQSTRRGPHGSVYDLRTTNLIGFENHSGKTYLGKGLKPLGKVLIGAGNNGEDGTEGAVHKNAFGCYLHGSLLPKNPHFADYLITKALERRYGQVKLKPLDDTIEWQTHKQAIERTRSQT